MLLTRLAPQGVHSQEQYEKLGIRALATDWPNPKLHLESPVALGPDQGTVPMMRVRCIAFVMWAMAPYGTMAQPTELFDCLGPGTDRVYCDEISSADFMDLTCIGDPRVYELYRGRIAWAPLKYVGPITVEVKAAVLPGTRFPLYIEFVDVKNYSAGTAFCHGAGNAAGVIMEVHGSPTCEGWETITTLDLAPWGMEIGDSYVIRAHFFNDSDLKFTSPYLRLHSCPACDDAGGERILGSNQVALPIAEVLSNPCS